MLEMTSGALVKSLQRTGLAGLFGSSSVHLQHITMHTLSDPVEAELL